jgi:uncharacterized DUF497 family protein
MRKKPEAHVIVLRARQLYTIGKWRITRNDPLDVNYEVIDGEERWTALGHTDNFRVLLLVWTVRHDALGIVTARAVGTRARDAYLRAKELLT